MRMDMCLLWLPYPLMLVNSVLLTAGASVFSLLMGFLGEVLDYRWCVTLGGAAALLACRFLIGGRRQDVRKVYEAG